MDFLTQDAGAMPEQVRELVQALIEGRVKQMLIIAEMREGTVFDGFHIIDDDANRYTMLGALETLKRDYMRAQIQPRIEYQEKDQDDDD